MYLLHIIVILIVLAIIGVAWRAYSVAKQQKKFCSDAVKLGVSQSVGECLGMLRLTGINALHYVPQDYMHCAATATTQDDYKTCMMAAAKANLAAQ